MWWLTLNHNIEELIKHCYFCQVNTHSKSHSQPLQLLETPQNNWEKLAVDLKGPLHSGEYNTCYHWLPTNQGIQYIAVVLKSTTTDVIIKQM